jgi:putative membrane protein
MQRKSRWAASVLVAGLGLGVGGGCSSMGGGSKAEAKAAKGDPSAQFMAETAHDSHSEIGLSQLAMQKATDPGVKQYAQMMVQDHQQGNQQLMQLAQEKGMDVPKRPDEAHVKELAHMKGVSGPQFDQEYMSAMVADHAKLLSKFQDKAANAQDPEVRAWAQSQVPVLQRHLDQARQISQSLGGASAVNAGATMRGSGTGGIGGPSNRTDSGTGAPAPTRDTSR